MKETNTKMKSGKRQRSPEDTCLWWKRAVQDSAVFWEGTDYFSCDRSLYYPVFCISESRYSLFGSRNDH